MFNSDKKTHYKMYKAGKRWMFGAITVTMFTAGIAGGTLLSNGKSVHADTVANTTQNQTSATSTDATDKSKDSSVQTDETKATPAVSQTNETASATVSNNDVQKSTTQNDVENTQNKSNDNRQTSDDSKNSSKAESTDKQEVDNNSTNQKNADTPSLENKAADTDKTNQTKTSDSKTDDQKQTVKADQTSATNQKTDDQKQTDTDKQATPENDVKKATEDATKTQNAETNLAATDSQPLKVTFTDPDYNKLGLPWVDPDANHFTYGYDTVGTHGAQNPDGSFQPLGSSPVKVRYIIWSTNRNGDGTVYYNEIDANGNLIDTVTLKGNGQSTDSQYIHGLTYYTGRTVEDNINSKSSGFKFGYKKSDDTNINPDNIAFTRNWAYDTENGVPGVQYGGENNFIPQLVKQTITWINKDTRAVMATRTYTSIAGQHYAVTGMPPEIPTNYYTSIVPTNASGTVSNFGISGTKWVSDRGSGGYTIYTETDDHGGMDVQTFDADGNIIKSNGYNPSANDGKGAVIPNGGSDTVHIDANYQYNSATQKYSWNVPGGVLTLLPIYVPQSRNIVFEIAPLGKLVPVDKNGTPIDNGSHDEPYKVDPTDPTKAQQPTIPDIPGYVPVDPNDPSKILNPGDPSPVPVKDPGTDTKIPYVKDEQTATITYVDQNGNKVLHTDDLSGKIGQHEDYSTDAELADLAKQGYTIVVSSDVPKNGITLDYNSGKPLAYTVVVTKGAVSVDQTGTGSLTIHYQYSDGTPVTEAANGSSVTDVKGDATFHRTVETDPYTGKVLNPDTPWVADNGQNVNVSANSPVVTGYYTNQANASGTVVEGKDATIVVVYNKLGNLIPEVPGGTPVPYPNDPTDPTKPGQPITPNYPGYTPLDPNGNPIEPGTPYPINPNEPGKDTPVPYVADAEKATVNYVDQDNNNAVLHSDALDGKFGEKSGYTTKDEISALENQGYELVTDGYPADYTFTTEDPTFTVVLKHKTKTVTPDNPGTPGQPVDPDNPTGPKYPDGTSEQDVVKDITRTIHYQYADGTEASKDVTEQVKYTRDVTFDEVTGKIISSTDWASQNPDYAEVTSPVIPGFVADQPVVGKATTKSTDSNSEVTVHYNAAAEKATVNYVDQDNNNAVLHSDALDGKFGEKSGYTTKDEIAALENQGYELVTDGYPADYTFTTEDPTFTVVLKHKTKTVTPDNPGTPGQPVDPDNPTGPKYPDGTNKDNLTKNVTRTIHYVDDQGNTVSADVDQATSFGREATFDEVTGKLSYTAWTPSDATFNEVNSPVITGYYTDTAKVSAEQVNADTANGEVTVVYHKLGNLIPEVPGGTPVPYPNDPTDPTKPGQPITPNYPGYTPLDPDGKPIVPGTPYPINPNEPGKDTPVPYVADAEQAHVNYVDQDNNDSIIKSDTLDGKFGEKSGYTTKDEIAALENQGYELVTDGYPADYTFTTEDPTFTVVLKHKTKTVTPDNPGTPGQPVDPNNPDGPKYPDGTSDQDLVKEVTRTIHYVDDQGNTVSPDVVETTKFGRDATFDEVTGKLSYGNWTPINDTFGAVNSPVINGYYTETPEVGAETVNADATNSEVTVLYHPLGHLVPDVPGSTPVIYPNNPTNPSEAGNPIIPDIPGYTPVDNNGNKLTPGTPYPIDHNDLGKDTPIHYVKNEVPATPETPSIPGNPATPTEPSVPVTPAQPETPVQPAKPATSEKPAAQPAQKSEAPAKAELPQTGQDATSSLMSIIGAILLAILGFFGLDGFRKKNDEK